MFGINFLFNQNVKQTFIAFEKVDFKYPIYELSFMGLKICVLLKTVLCFSEQDSTLAENLAQQHGAMGKSFYLKLAGNSFATGHSYQDTGGPCNSRTFYLRICLFTFVKLVQK